MVPESSISNCLHNFLVGCDKSEACESDNYKLTAFHDTCIRRLDTLSSPSKCRADRLMRTARAGQNSNRTIMVYRIHLILHSV